jgi:spermidine synthase
MPDMAIWVIAAITTAHHSGILVAQAPITAPAHAAAALADQTIVVAARAAVNKMGTPSDTASKKHSLTLIYSAFIAGLCSIIYELLIATTVSYFMGDSVKYFSITIGIYMAAMGLGSYVSKYIDQDILVKFIKAELALGILGGLSIPALYTAYAFGDIFVAVYIFFTFAIGFLIGLEIPFLTRLMEEHNQLKVNIANVLSFDYLGALIATISFPFLLLPLFGVYQSSLLFGLVNMSIGFAVLWMFSDKIGRPAKYLKIITFMLSIFIILMLIFSNSFLRHWDQNLYEDRIIYSEQSPYQRIILTKDRNDIRLFLNGNLQFSSSDEYRYHEALVHVPFSVSKAPIRNVLILGAGDGLAIREILKHTSVKKITLVDLDKSVVELASTNHYLTALNQNSLESEKLTIEFADAFTFLEKRTQRYDLIISDLPDPNNNSLARLYSKQYYKLVNMNLAPQGIFISQATSPYFATEAYWSIVKTLQASKIKNVYPYHASVPSFGDWGFVMASNIPLNIEAPTINIPTRFIDQQNFASLFTFSKDIINHDVEVNMLDKPILLDYYLRGWEKYAR